MSEIPQPRQQQKKLIKWAMAGLGIAGALGIGGYAVNQKVNGGGEEGDNNGAPVVVVPEKTVSPDATVQPTENPKTVEPTKVPEKSPYNFNWEKKFGDVTVRIEDKLQERTECPDPGVSAKSASLIACGPITDITINRDDFPNIDEDMSETAREGFYYAWKSQDSTRETVTYEEYKSKLANGEDLSFKTRGFQGDSFLPTDIMVSPTDKIYIDWISEPISIFKSSTSNGVGYRKINNEFHIEQWIYMPPNGEHKDITSKYPVGSFRTALSYLSYYEIIKKGYMTPAEQGFSLDVSKVIGTNLTKKNADGSSSYAMYLE